jgi:ABC-2 type transport system permease protein
MQNYMVDMITKGTEFAEAIRRAMPPLYYFGKGIAEASAVDEALFVLCMILPFMAVVELLAINYRKILTSNRGPAKTIYKEKAAKASSPFSALVRKEMALYWSKPFVVLNTSLGSMFLLITPIGVVLSGSELYVYLDAFDEMMGGFAPAALAAITLAFLCTTNTLSSSLVSLEGKNIWIAKNLPLTTRMVLQAKNVAHLLVSALPCLLASLTMAVVIARSLRDWLLILLLPLLTNIFIAVSGTAINLLFPKLDWINELQVVKQGFSAMLMIFAAVGMAVGLGFVYALLLSDYLTLTTFLWLCTAFFTIASAAIYAWVATVGEKIFREL